MANPARSRPILPAHPSAAVSWTALYAAITLDVAQVFALDYSDGFSDPLLAAAAVAAFCAELYLFSIALLRITSTVAYGLLGFGTATVAVISIGWLGEQLTPIKAGALLAVLLGAGLLNTEGTKPAATPTPDGTDHVPSQAEPPPGHRRKH